MSSCSHWSPRYLWDRVNEFLYRRQNPERPWLTPAANRMIAEWLEPTDRVLELGSGRSTVWFAARAAHVISIEHDREWHEKIAERLERRSMDNVDYRFGEQLEEDEDASEVRSTGYLRAVREVSDVSIDLALVDGAHRDASALTAVSKVVPGGALVVDNANWFLPSRCRAPDSVGPDEEPTSADWREFQRRVASWRSIWTENGVTATAFWIKPC